MEPFVQNSCFISYLLILSQAKIKIIFVSPYPTDPKNCPYLKNFIAIFQTRFFFFFFFNTERQRQNFRVLKDKLSDNAFSECDSLLG